MFDSHAYKEFLQHLKKKYTFHTFSSFNGLPGIILRHDVDLDLSFALRMAQIEKDLGIQATYFIMITSPAYNPLCKSGRLILKKIVESGAEIGLHFDPSLYEAKNDADFETYALHEAKMLEKACGKNINSLSLHCPSVNGIYPKFRKFINTYDCDFFSKERYCSDSCKSFRDKDPYEWVKLGESKTIQFLTHPLHYTGEGHNYVDHMLLHLKAHAELVEEEFKVNPLYLKDFAGKKLSEYVRKTP